MARIVADVVEWLEAVAQAEVEPVAGENLVATHSRTSGLSWDGAVEIGGK